MDIKALISQLSTDSSWKSLQEARSLLQKGLSRTDRIALGSFLNGNAVRSRDDFSRRQVRVALASDSTIENLCEPLLIRLLERSMFGCVYQAPYGQLAQEVRDPSSGLLQHQADVVVLAPFTTIWSQIQAGTPADVKHFLDEAWTHLTSLREKFDGIVLIVNAVPPESRPHGILDSRRSPGHADFARALNLALSERCRTSGEAFVLDAEFLNTRCGSTWTTLHKQQFMGSRPLSDELAAKLASDVVSFCAARKGFARKVLALDLDNTLWGGIVGEDGWQEVKIGGSYPANLYSELQREIRSLRDRGVALVLISKNNEHDAWEVFDRRSEMVLKRSDITAHRINWNDKVHNLRELAAELNLGLDAFVVLDDNPVERTFIEQSLPEVEVCPAGDPLEMLRWLTTCGRFDTLAITQEDELRAKSYAAAAERKRLASQTTNLDEYLATLETVVEVGKLTDKQLSRVAQLTQKTNQFNLTTRRYSEHDLQTRMEDANWNIYWCSCRDRFADEGIIGAAIAVEEDQGWHIDTLLMSCRVLGRGVEKAFLQTILDEAEKRGAKYVSGEYIRTTKNGQTEQFFATCGFEPTEQSSDRAVWRKDLPAEADLAPRTITLQAMMS